MPISNETFDGLTGAMFRLILTMDDARSAMGDRLGIGVTGLKTISILNREGASTAGALATAAGITSGSMTATIDKLVDNHLATRTPNPDDRRGVLVELTPGGKDAVAWVLRYYYEALAVPLSHDSNTQVISAYLLEASDQLAALAERVPNLPR